MKRAFKADAIPETYTVITTMRNERAKPLPCNESVPVEVMLPSDLLHWIWMVHPDQFRDRVLGSAAAVPNFWASIKELGVNY